MKSPLILQSQSVKYFDVLLDTSCCPLKAHSMLLPILLHMSQNLLMNEWYLSGSPKNDGILLLLHLHLSYLILMLHYFTNAISRVSGELKA